MTALIFFGMTLVASFISISHRELRISCALFAAMGAEMIWMSATPANHLTALFLAVLGTFILIVGTLGTIFAPSKP